MLPLAINEILVTTDFSKSAFNAVKFAFAFSEITNAKITLFHAYTNFSSGVALHDTLQNAEKEMLKLLDSLKVSFPNIKPDSILVAGIASEKIAEFVKQKDIHLLIMGTKGEGAYKDELIGSTTEKVISETPCTIIAVPLGAKFKGVKKVAIATGLEEGGLLAITEAITLAKQLDAEITLVHVEDLEFFYLEDSLHKMVEKLKRQSEYLKITYHICKDSDIINGLNIFIKKNKPDILSMITHHNINFPKSTGEKSWTNKMSHHTSIPVLILHADKPTDLKAETSFEIDKPLTTN